MRRVTFNSVLQAASILWDGKSRPDVRTAAQLGVLLNKRAVELWEMFPWPEWCPTERRTYAPIYDPALTHATPSVVYYPPTDTYYQCLVAAATLAPADSDENTNSTQWRSAPVCDTPTDWTTDLAWVTGDLVRHPVSLRTFSALMNKPSQPAHFTVRVVDMAETLDVLDVIPGAFVDGVILAVGDRVLIIENTLVSFDQGIWVVGSALGPTRATDADTYDEVLGTPYVAATEGTLYGGKWFSVDGSGMDAPLPSQAKYNLMATPSAATEPGVDAGWPAQWGEMFDFFQVVGLDQAGETPMGECFKAWNADPRSDRCAVEQGKEIIQEGILLATAPNMVWLRFRERAPAWTGDLWDAAVTYGLDDQVWNSDEGDYFKSLAASNLNHDVTNTTWWERIEFPYVLRDAVPQAAYSDLLRMDGQQEKFITEQAEAFRLLRREFDKLERQQGQTRPLAVRSRC